jgi:hypothetical protein
LDKTAGPRDSDACSILIAASSHFAPTSLPLPINHPITNNQQPPNLITHYQQPTINTNMPIDLPQPPPYVNIPAYTYDPPTHSYGTGMVRSITVAVSASSLAGGYNDVERPRIEDIGVTEYRNHLRLITLIWGSNDTQAIDSILQLDRPKCNHAQFLSKQFAKRFAAQKSNHIYHMVKEAVEVHDLHVTLRNMARVSVLCRVAIPDDIPEQQARRLRIADEWHSSVHSTRGRAITRLEEKMAQVEKGIPGAIQAKRLRGMRDRLAVDPFVGLEIDVDDDDAEEEPVYWELNKEDRKQFWLERYGENVVAWYWDFRGIFDICATVTSEPFRTFSRLEFANACDAMFNIIGMDVDYERRVQHANVHARTLIGDSITKADEKAYRKTIGRLNNKYNGDVDDGLLDPPAGKVRSLNVLGVAPRSILVKNGFVDSATEIFAGAAERKYQREGGQGVVRSTMNLPMLVTGGAS